MTHGLLLAIHFLAVMVWVGGMFFVYWVLRPNMAMLEPPQRLKLWRSVLSNFFAWLWLVIFAVLASGYGMIFAVYGSFANAQPFIHWMHLLGLLMTFIFLIVYCWPFQVLKKAVEAEDWPKAGAQIKRMRLAVATNLSLGIITVIVATAGRYHL